MNRLVVHTQFLLLQRTAQLNRRLDPLLGVGSQLFRVEGVAVPASTFGLEQRRVGVTQQLFSAQRISRKQADTDAGIDKQLMPVNQERLLEAIDDPLSQRRRLHQLRTVLGQHGELITAQPRQGNSLAEQGLQPFGHGLEQLITDRVPEAVVDHLEMIQINQQ
ncbi:hypothetical protein D3C87_1570270 [compost metagenome]